jgi:hypothetical protein
MMPLQDIYEETRRILSGAQERGITLRLLGGMAIRFLCRSALTEALNRKYVDVDLVGHAKQSKQIKALFGDLGYSPRSRFNAMHGDKRLVFNDLEHQRRVDVFLDVFEMCHKFNFKDRLGILPYTLPVVDLLATKLQVVQMTEREYKDLMCLLLDHAIGTRDEPDVINGAHLAKLASDDWGLHMTFKQTIQNLLDAIDAYSLTSEQQQIVEDRAQQILRMIEQQPKTMRWKMRARVGEKVPWYELPEADKEVVN